MATTRPHRPNAAPSRSTLARLPGRVVAFLHALGGYPALRAALKEGGYTAADHEEGLVLLRGLLEYGADPGPCDGDRRAREAREEIEGWVPVHFPRLSSAVARMHPDARSPFARIERPDRQGAVVALATLLGRIAKDGGAEVDGVLGTLERRGLGREEIERLGELVARARAVAVDRHKPGRDGRRAELLALHRWYSDWAGTARALVERRDWLILMGLSARRREGVDEEAQAHGGPP